jgi:hypothetical protein
VGRDFHCETRNPKDPTGSKITVVLPGKLIERYHKKTYVAFQNFEAAKEVLDNPQRIFTVIREFGEEQRWCYSGHPERWYVAENVAAPFPEDLVFAVYLYAGASAIIIYNWRAEHAAQDDPMSPVDWQNRYGELLWRSTS